MTSPTTPSTTSLQPASYQSTTPVTSWTSTTPVTSSGDGSWWSGNNVDTMTSAETATPATTTTEMTSPMTSSTTTETATSATTPQPNYAQNGGYYYQYLDASGYPRIEQGYYKRVKGQLVLVKQGGYTVLYPDNRLHWISYIADEYGFRTKDYIFYEM
nr:PREDICTED: cell wall protein DAN4-like [Bemisia tabaci]